MLERHAFQVAAGLAELTFPQMLVAGVALIFGVLMLVFLGVFASVGSLWFRAFMSGAGIGPLQMVVMKLKKVNPQLIVDTRIMSVQAGLDDITTNAMESHYLAGGNVPLVIRALIAAHRAQIDLDWKTAAAIDLAGRNVLEAVQTSVKTKVIDCPDPGRSGRPSRRRPASSTAPRHPAPRRSGRQGRLWQCGRRATAALWGPSPVRLPRRGAVRPGRPAPAPSGRRRSSPR